MPIEIKKNRGPDQRPDKSKTLQVLTHVANVWKRKEWTGNNQAPQTEKTGSTQGKIPPTNNEDTR